MKVFPSLIDDYALLESVITDALNRNELSDDARRQLLHTMIDELYDTKIISLVKDMLPPGESEEIISLWKVEQWCRALVAAMKTDNFSPTHIVAITNGGLIIAYFLNKIMWNKCPILPVSVQSYKDKESTRLVETTSPLFPLNLDHIATDVLSHERFLIVDELTQTDKTMKHVYNKVYEALFAGREYQDWVQPMIKTAVLYKKWVYVPDYYYQEKESRLVFPWETVLPKDER